MESDYQSLFQVRLANYDDIPAIMNITREAFVKYQQMSGVENLAALEESYNDVKKDIDTKVVLLALSDGEPVGSVRVEVFPDKTAYLSRFAVKVTSQNNGIGKSIMNLVDKIMVKKGVTQIQLHTGSKITSLIRFYFYYLLAATIPPRILSPSDKPSFTSILIPSDKPTVTARFSNNCSGFSCFTICTKVESPLNSTQLSGTVRTSVARFSTISALAL